MSIASMSVRQLLGARAVKATAFADRAGRRQGRGAVWVKPDLVCTQVEFTEWTPDGRLRHPSFQGLRGRGTSAGGRGRRDQTLQLA